MSLLVEFLGQDLDSMKTSLVQKVALRDAIVAAIDADIQSMRSRIAVRELLDSTGIIKPGVTFDTVATFKSQVPVNESVTQVVSAPQADVATAVLEDCVAQPAELFTITATMEQVQPTEPLEQTAVDVVAEHVSVHDEVTSRESVAVTAVCTGEKAGDEFSTRAAATRAANSLTVADRAALYLEAQGVSVSLMNIAKDLQLPRTTTLKTVMKADDRFEECADGKWQLVKR